ncbi:MAG: hypothetical protein JW860_14370, partial [Sedimentisphaerales bacterium]|nr:hypothetical protein [Sedimentisphaerales bacterium]
MRISRIIQFGVWILLGSVLQLAAAPSWLHRDGNQLKDPNDNVVVLRGISLIDLGFLEGWQGGAVTMIDRLTDPCDVQGNSTGWYPRVIRIPVFPPDTV